MAEEDPRSRAEEEGDLLREVFVVASLATIGFPLVVLGCAVYWWLRTGVWSTPRTWEGLNYVGVPYPDLRDWQGVQKVLTWLLDFPLWFGGTVILLIVAVVFWKLATMAYARDRKG